MDLRYLPQMADESRRSYLFVVIDSAKRGVFVQIRFVKPHAVPQAC